MGHLKDLGNFIQNCVWYRCGNNWPVDSQNYHHVVKIPNLYYWTMLNQLRCYVTNYCGGFFNFSFFVFTTNHTIINKIWQTKLPKCCYLFNAFSQKKKHSNSSLRVNITNSSFLFYQLFYANLWYFTLCGFLLTALFYVQLLLRNVMIFLSFC